MNSHFLQHPDRPGYSESNSWSLSLHYHLTSQCTSNPRSSVARYTAGPRCPVILRPPKTVWKTIKSRRRALSAPRNFQPRQHPPSQSRASCISAAAHESPIHGGAVRLERFYLRYPAAAYASVLPFFAAILRQGPLKTYLPHPRPSLPRCWLIRGQSCRPHIPRYGAHKASDIGSPILCVGDR